MNKIAQGALAISCGLLLTLGAAGSIAYWQTQAGTGATTFTTGDIDLMPRSGEEETGRASDWTLDGVMIDHEALQNTPLVPGSTVEWTQRYRLDQNGSGLYLELDVAVGGITADTSDGTSPFVVTRADPVTVSGSSVALTPVPGSPDTYSVTGKGDFEITTTFAWPFGTSPDSSNKFEERTIDLASSTMTLRQVANPADEVD